MKIDAHQHFWRVDRGDYGWLTPDLPIYRDYLPEDLKPLLEAAGIDGTVLVQAAPTDAETQFMLDLAARHDWIKGVVGWTDFTASDAPDRVAALGQEPKLTGLRPMIQDIAQDDWMLRADVGEVLKTMTQTGLVFDALTLPRHLPSLRRLLEAHPDLTVVIDHASKEPVNNDGPGANWRADMIGLARDTRACVKLSGLVTEATSDWHVDMLRPYVDLLREAFGPARMIWGSDWPVCTLAASYEDWDAATRALLADLSEPERMAILGDNAQRTYGF